MKLFEKNPAAVWMALLGGFFISAAVTLSFSAMGAPERLIHEFPVGLMGIYIIVTTMVFSNYKILEVSVKQRALFASILTLSLFALPAVVWAFTAG